MWKMPGVLYLLRRPKHRMLKFSRVGSSEGAKNTSSGRVIFTIGMLSPSSWSCPSIPGSKAVHASLNFTSEGMSLPGLSVFSTGSRKYVITGAPVTRLILAARGKERRGSVIITSGLKSFARRSKYMFPTPSEGHVITVKPSCL
ncbi:MAG: hypothetical protein IJT02_09825 [Synergistaceae bacterium]|nr:hypothetical protein [Synergistaceae bacterium]